MLPKLRILNLSDKATYQKELSRMGIYEEEVQTSLLDREILYIKAKQLNSKSLQLLKLELEKCCCTCLFNKEGSRPLDASIYALLIGSKDNLEKVVKELLMHPNELLDIARALEFFLETLNNQANLKLNCRGKILDLSKRTHIMGIINCTPDSFYSGSRIYESQKAVEFGVQMVQDGADILDIGGESTRPASKPVTLDEELRRVMPVIEGLIKAVHVPLSIDTYKSTVAKHAFELGVNILNDISALNFDSELGKIAAKFDVPVILMHIKGKPKDMQRNPSYFNLMDEISEYFEKRIDYASECGIKKENIVVDPGIGFGKSIHDNYEILNRLSELQSLGCPILVGPSRKSFIGKVLNLPPEESLEGTIAASTIAILNGANILRVHDVREMVRATKIADRLAGKIQNGALK